MPYTLPALGTLATLLSHVKEQARGRRQEKLAELVLAEYESLLRYAESLTRLLNDDHPQEEESRAPLLAHSLD